MLEVNSINPNKVEPTVNINLSTSEASFFASTPIGSKAGFYIGGTNTWWQVPLSLFGVSRAAPYITQGYGKFVWTPVPSVNWFLDLYAGTDGVSVANNTRNPQQPPNTLTTTGSTDYSNSETLVALGAKFLLSNNLLLDTLLNFNSHAVRFQNQSVVDGTQYYSQDFIDTFGPFPGGATSFMLNNLTSTANQSVTDYLYQAKADLAWQIGSGLLSFGVESVLRNSAVTSHVDDWQTVYHGATPDFVNVISDVTTPGNNTVTSGLYTDYNFSLWSGTLTGDAGVRANYTFVYNGNMMLQTIPSVDPRIRLSYTPVRNSGPFESLSLVGGIALFSEFPVDNRYIDAQYGVTNWQINPTHAWFNELGLQAAMKNGWTAEVGGYFKYYFDRFCVIGDTSATPESYALYNDGTGYAYGADFSFGKNTRFWQAQLADTFVITRLSNPG